MMFDGVMRTRWSQFPGRIADISWRRMVRRSGVGGGPVEPDRVERAHLQGGVQPVSGARADVVEPHAPHRPPRDLLNSGRVAFSGRWERHCGLLRQQVGELIRLSQPCGQLRHRVVLTRELVQQVTPRTNALVGLSVSRLATDAIAASTSPDGRSSLISDIHVLATAVARRQPMCRSPHGMGPGVSPRVGTGSGRCRVGGYLPACAEAPSPDVNWYMGL